MAEEPLSTRQKKKKLKENKQNLIFSNPLLGHRRIFQGRKTRVQASLFCQRRIVLNNTRGYLLKKQSRDVVTKYKKKRVDTITNRKIQELSTEFDAAQVFSVVTLDRARVHCVFSKNIVQVLLVKFRTILYNYQKHIQRRKSR